MRKDHKNYNEDFLIKKAALSLAEDDSELFDLLEKDNTIINPLQEELDNKIYKIISNKLGQNNAKSRIKKMLLKAAIFVLVFTTGFAVSFVSVDAFRELILNFYIKDSSSYTSYHPNNEDYIFPYIKSENINYIPKGYNLIDNYETQTSLTYIYSNSLNKVIYITFYERNTSFGVDTEDADTLNITVNNSTAYIHRKDGLATLVFKYRGNPVLINSDAELSNEELIKIAEKIK